MSVSRMSWNHSRHPPGLQHAEFYWTGCLDTSPSLWKSLDVPPAAHHVQGPDVSLRADTSVQWGDAPTPCGRWDDAVMNLSSMRLAFYRIYVDHSGHRSIHCSESMLAWQPLVSPMAVLSEGKHLPCRTTSTFHQRRHHPRRQHLPTTSNLD